MDSYGIHKQGRNGWQALCIASLSDYNVASPGHFQHEASMPYAVILKLVLLFVFMLLSQVNFDFAVERD